MSVYLRLLQGGGVEGSSGSPVMLSNIGMYSDKGGNTIMGNRLKLLGVLYAGPQHLVTGEIRIVAIPTAERSISVAGIPNNLGMVIRASRILDFEPVLKERRGTTKV